MTLLPRALSALRAVALCGGVALVAACAQAPTPAAPAAAGNLASYPTSLRVEYVQECINVNGGAFALLYQCSCALDRMATTFSHDEFVEASTYAKYSGLAGERGGEFREHDRARELTRKFRTEQSAAYKSCNVTPVVRPK